MNSTHIAVLSAIQRLKIVDANIQAIPLSRPTEGDGICCRNCQVFSRQMTKLSIENQKLQQISQGVDKQEQEYRYMEELCKLKNDQIQILRSQVQKLEHQKAQMRAKVQDFKRASLRSLEGDYVS